VSSRRRATIPTLLCGCLIRVGLPVDHFLPCDSPADLDDELHLVNSASRMVGGVPRWPGMPMDADFDRLATSARNSTYFAVSVDCALFQKGSICIALRVDISLYHRAASPEWQFFIEREAARNSLCWDCFWRLLSSERALGGIRTSSFTHSRLLRVRRIRVVQNDTTRHAFDRH
jgi:hypothetical protein